MSGVIAAISWSGILGICAAVATVVGAIIGLIFRGAAVAWKEERDAAVDKADRLEEQVNDQADQIAALETKVAELEKRTDYEAYAERSGREHKQIIDTLAELTRGLHANTVATEFLIKQAFPAASLPITIEGATT